MISEMLDIDVGNLRGRGIDMQRILNNPDDIVDEMLKGFLKAHADVAEATGNPVS